MRNYLDALPSYVEKIKAIREIIITNIVLTGQIPAPTFHENQRVNFLLDRLSEFQVDECTTDSFNNPICIIRGTSPIKPPIFIAAHVDTFVKKEMEHNFTVGENTISGPGITENSLAVGVLASLPEIFKKLNLHFESDIVLTGVRQSLGQGNLKGIRQLLKTWPTPIRGAIILESVELGRLNYYSEGMIRGEIDCSISTSHGHAYQFKPNAILVINEVINQILKLRLPQKPRSRVVIGTIKGGFNHGEIAYDANIGFEIRSDSDDMVEELYNDISDIVEGINHEYDVQLKLNTLIRLFASTLKFNHPLVKRSGLVMKKLNIDPVSSSSESELSIFLSHKIPAVTLGLTMANTMGHETATVEIEPLFKGIAQVIGVLLAIDRGVTDERQLD